MEVATQGISVTITPISLAIVATWWPKLVCVMRFWCPQAAKDGKSRATP
jgi:hypothetical protein